MKKLFDIKRFITLFLTSLLLVMPILSFSNIAYAELTIYDFSDEAQAQFDAEINKTETLKEETPKLEKTKTNKKQQAQPTQKQEIKTTTQNINTTNDDYIVIKNGESLYATLQSSISSASIDKNDTIAATLEQDWKYKGKLIAPKGSILYGNATEAKRAGIFLRDGSMGIEFNQLMTPDGSRISLSSNKVTLNAHGEKKLNAVRNIACGAVMGVVSGLFYTLLSGGDVAKGIAIGASVGAAGGVVTTAMQKGNDVEVPAGTVIRVELTKNMNAMPYNQ